MKKTLIRRPPFDFKKFSISNFWHFGLYCLALFSMPIFVCKFASNPSFSVGLHVGMGILAGLALVFYLRNCVFYPCKDGTLRGISRREAAFEDHDGEPQRVRALVLKKIAAAGLSQMNIQLSTAFKEGFTAEKLGIPRRNCPVVVESDEGKEWLKGWDFGNLSLDE